MTDTTSTPACIYCRPQEPCMFHAIISGNVVQVRKLLTRGPGALNESHWNYLELAVRHGYPDICELLVAHGIDVDKVDTNLGNEVVLSSAAHFGQERSVRWLLAHGASVDGAQNSSRTPLISAAIKGHLDIARILLDAGAEVNREALRSPATALDFAELYKGTKAGEHAAVADLLRAHGGIQPYNVRWNWTGARGQAHVEHIQDALWSVHPKGISRAVSPGNMVEVHKSRFFPNKWLYQLLFTADLARATGVEIGICLPREWPLNQLSLKEHKYNWPYELLFKVAEWLISGGKLAHGNIIDASHPSVTGFQWQQGIPQWLIAHHTSIEQKRAKGIAETLILFPVTTKKLIKSGADSRARADKIASSKWGPSLAVPLCYRASWFDGEAPRFAEFV